jgi:hypothetical protein
MFNFLKRKSPQQNEAKRKTVFDEMNEEIIKLREELWILKKELNLKEGLLYNSANGYAYTYKTCSIGFQPYGSVSYTQQEFKLYHNGKCIFESDNVCEYSRVLYNKSEDKIVIAKPLLSGWKRFELKKDIVGKYFLVESDIMPEFGEYTPLENAQGGAK